MAKSPAFQFYAKDWLSDANVRSMSFAAKGVYIDLLAIYWNEGGLPASTDRLARLVGMAPAKFRRLWPAIEPCFVRIQEQLSQKRLEDEKSKQEQFRSIQSTKGQLSAKSRAVSTDSQPRLNREATEQKSPVQPEVNSPFPSPFPSAKNGRTNERSGPPANPFLGPGDKERLASECMALVRKLSSLTGEEPLDVMARASGYEGAKTTKVNPSAMSDDRLINTVRDLRADVAAEEKRRGAVKPVGV